LSKKQGKKESKYEEDKKGVAAVENQLNQKYQKGVVESQLENNKGIHHFNNRKN